MIDNDLGPSCKNMSEPCPVVIKGDLQLGYALRWPVHLILHCELGYYYWVVAENDFVHGIGGTPEEAIDDYKWIPVEFYELLEEESWRLAPYLRLALKWLRELLARQK